MNDQKSKAMSTLFNCIELKLMGMLLLLGTLSSLHAMPGRQAAPLEAPRVYVKIQVDGLACPFCAYGLEKKLKKMPGIQELNISIKGGYVTFSLSQKDEHTEEQLRQLVKEAGFTARGITFSAQPFKES